MDPKYVEQMRSPYLMAHGISVPLDNADTKVIFKKKGKTKFRAWFMDKKENNVCGAYYVKFKKI